LAGLLYTPADRVCGVVLHSAAEVPRQVRARIVVGADGRRATLARLVGAEAVKTGPSAAANVFGYWSGIPVEGYRWYYRPGLSAGAIPTNDGHTCIFASVPAAQFGAVFRHDLEAGYRSVIAEVAPDLAAPMRAATLAAPLKGAPGQPGFFRRSAGPGWVLVGDAGYFKDPLTAHGITDALRDAELLARAIDAGSDEALAEYQEQRDVASLELFETTDAIASFSWNLTSVRVLHEALAKAMSREVR